MSEAREQTRPCGREGCDRKLGSGYRKHAQYCSSICRAEAWRQAHSTTAGQKRTKPFSGGEGSRGGNVRSVDEARILQSESKERDRWRLVMEIQIHRTLLSTGYFHVDDLDPLGVPPLASEVKGTLINSVRARGYMKSTEVRRKVAHAAANARKAPIYKITAKGRRELPKLVEDLKTDLAGVGGGNKSGCLSHSDSSGHSPHSGEPGLPGPGSGAGVASSRESPGDHVGPPSTDTASPVTTTQPTGVHGGKDPQEKDGIAAGSRGSVHSGGSEEPQKLFEDLPPSAYDRLKDVA